MMSLTFYTNENNTNSIEISDKAYKKLAYSGLEKVVDFKDISIKIEGEDYEINAAELSYDNRKKIIGFVERERQNELVILFENMDNNPTIKEIRENFSYIKYLTEIYKQISDKSNIYFSYE